MEEFKKGIYDLLIREKELPFFQEDDIRELENIDDEWLANQFSRHIKENLSNFHTIEDKIIFLNNLIKEDKWTSLRAVKKEIKINRLEEISTNKLIKKNLWSNLNKEFESSNDIQIISPFISNHMINILRNSLENNSSIKSLKIIKTKYDGTSKFLALEDLIKLVNEYSNIIQVKIENMFKKSEKRLHIKSYLFNRENNFSSLYVGSSNFTKTGLVTGKEHNLRISEFKDKKIIEEYRKEFDDSFKSNDLVDIKDNEQIQQIIMHQKLEQ